MYPHELFHFHYYIFIITLFISLFLRVTLEKDAKALKI